jgi:hypothetical protein
MENPDELDNLLADAHTELFAVNGSQPPGQAPDDSPSWPSHWPSPREQSQPPAQPQRAANPSPRGQSQPPAQPQRAASLSPRGPSQPSAQPQRAASLSPRGQSQPPAQPQRAASPRSSRRGRPPHGPSEDGSPRPRRQPAPSTPPSEGEIAGASAQDPGPQEGSDDFGEHARVPSEGDFQIPELTGSDTEVEPAEYPPEVAPGPPRRTAAVPRERGRKPDQWDHYCAACDRGGPRNKYQCRLCRRLEFTHQHQESQCVYNRKTLDLGKPGVVRYCPTCKRGVKECGPPSPQQAVPSPLPPADAAAVEPTDDETQLHGAATPRSEGAGLATSTSGATRKLARGAHTGDAALIQSAVCEAQHATSTRSDRHKNAFRAFAQAFVPK